MSLLPIAVQVRTGRGGFARLRQLCSGSRGARRPPSHDFERPKNQRQPGSLCNGQRNRRRDRLRSPCRHLLTLVWRLPSRRYRLRLFLFVGLSHTTPTCCTAVRSAASRDKSPISVRADTSRLAMLASRRRPHLTLTGRRWRGEHVNFCNRAWHRSADGLSQDPAPPRRRPSRNSREARVEPRENRRSRLRER